ncbi:unnamed protein product [Ambrosiozyma monospora]|uniref:Unnamed protein product n=1 Tax=Ambrosiozyma monospora TaxID=43982 RepID=A0ACB5SZ87_AMBMO|nr:unnamed protein product [Ambrosiozyma monospora]
MTIVLSPFIKKVIKVPKEIQFIIFRFVIHNYLRRTNMDEFPENESLCSEEIFRPPLNHLTALMGFDTDLDNIIAIAIEELTFDESIFSRPQLSKFRDFVLAKLIKIRLRAPFGIELNKYSIELLNHGCYEYLIFYISNPDSRFIDGNLKFITFLTVKLDSLSDLYKETKDLKLLERLKRLRLKCLKILATSSQLDLLDEAMAQKLISWSRENQVVFLKM